MVTSISKATYNIFRSSLGSKAPPPLPSCVVSKIHKQSAKINLWISQKNYKHGGRVEDKYGLWNYCKLFDRNNPVQEILPIHSGTMERTQVGEWEASENFRAEKSKQLLEEKARMDSK